MKTVSSNPHIIPIHQHFESQRRAKLGRADENQSVDGIGAIPGLSVPVKDATVAKIAGKIAEITGVVGERAAELVYISSSMLTLMIQNCTREVTEDLVKGELNQIMQQQTLLKIRLNLRSKSSLLNTVSGSLMNSCAASVASV